MYICQIFHPMYLIHTIDELQKALQSYRINKQIGFVPTMGALHAGHISLVETSVKENEATVVSIYVNPTQFNDKNDLARYPRVLDRDLEFLKPTGCQFVFAPSDQEIYPVPDTRQFNFGILEQVMEGQHRPGHFNGVGQIVSKLFDAVMPHKAYFGLKDFQQLAIIKKLVSDLAYPIEIIPCPIVREVDGLAMSSRNALLLPAMRNSAPLIYQSLCKLKEGIHSRSVTELKSLTAQFLAKDSNLRLEYIEIVDDNSLQPVEKILPEKPITACIAVHAGNVRLIDNIQINS